MFQIRAKHFDVRYQFMREIISEGRILLQKIETTENIVDYRVLEVEIVSKTTETKKKKFSKNPPKDPLRRQIRFKNKTGCEIYTSRQCKSIPKGNAVTTEANHVLGLPLIVSTRRVKPITSKATISDKAPC